LAKRKAGSIKKTTQHSLQPSSTSFYGGGGGAADDDAHVAFDSDPDTAKKGVDATERATFGRNSFFNHNPETTKSSQETEELKNKEGQQNNSS
jgi:hypothetical protein